MSAAPICPALLVVPFEQVSAIEIGGPGLVADGGVFAGGGFGPQGVAEGMAIATLLNALTTRTKINTVLGVQWEHWEVVFHHSVHTPQALRLQLAPVLGRLRANQRQPSASNRSQVDELERLGTLFERGLLTPEEFAAAKKNLLDRLELVEGAA